MLSKQAIIHCLLFPLWNMKCPYNASRVSIRTNGHLICRYTAILWLKCFMTSWAVVPDISCKISLSLCQAKFEKQEDIRAHHNEQHTIYTTVLEEYVDSLDMHRDHESALDGDEEAQSNSSSQDQQVWIQVHFNMHQPWQPSCLSHLHG